MAEIETPVYAVLLAGGIGTRLWPVSRQLSPKQLVKFIGRDSLVQATVRRLLPAVAADAIRIVCGAEHRHDVARHLKEMGIAAGDKIICEPCGRNTAPAILLAVLKILQQEEDAIVCVFPADHVIKDTAAFHDRLRSAITLADSGGVVTFGIAPHYPETGYGYIEGGDKMAGGALKTRRFVEKPDLATARQYLAAGNFFWNSGMFAFRASVVLEEFEQYQPELLGTMTGLDLYGDRLEAADYLRLPDISIDVAIMERTGKGVVLPSDFGWSDIGSWKSLYDFLPKDQDDNVIDGDVIVQQTRHCFIKAHERLIAANRLDGLVIVETPDAIFVSDMENSREVKSIVAQLKEKKRAETIRHKTVFYPWGSKTLLERREGADVTRLNIDPDNTCPPAASPASSLTVVAGTGRIGGKVMERGHMVGATAGARLSIENCGKEPLVVIQVTLSAAEKR
ncbi:MAG: mannose-1-phosphate guanylyltransferase/mannose-6-phosphate isomerase [Desulfobacterales bacterium]